MTTAILIDKTDNVAIVTSKVEEGEEIIIPEKDMSIKALEPVSPGHKIALMKIEAGEYVIKYGIPIGRMISSVDPGGWISVHNLEDITEELCEEYCRMFRNGEKTVRVIPEEESVTRKINAFPRKDGTFGIRNCVMVISTSHECNRAAEIISDTTGCAWFVCDKTRLENGTITDYTRKAMIFTGRNPNVFAALILGCDSHREDGQ